MPQFHIGGPLRFCVNRGASGFFKRLPAQAPLLQNPLLFVIAMPG